MSREEQQDYSEWFEVFYTSPFQAKRFLDLIYDSRLTKDAVKIRNAVQIYQKPFSRDFAYIFFESLRRTDQTEVIISDDAYCIKGVTLSPPKDVSDFIDDCVRFGVKLMWDIDIYKQYLV